MINYGPKFWKWNMNTQKPWIIYREKCVQEEVDEIDVLPILNYFEENPRTQIN